MGDYGGMYRIAIVEDDKSFTEELKKYLEQYSQEEGQEFEISTFYCGRFIMWKFKTVSFTITRMKENL